ncbi:MAG: hypothetical protein B7Z20_05610 [Sphingobium sp. 32-64-5]|nr:MAG: hypothetical protein B7Z20_05610 [Sphingobium sp. 32-64-5]
MTERQDQEQNGGPENAGREPGAGEERAAGQAATRRKLLLGGGLAAASAVVSIRPALANTAASVLNCHIPVPDPAKAVGKMISAEGQLVPKGTKGAFPASNRPYTGEEVKAALRGGRNLPGTTYDQNRAYLNYIRRLQNGTSGFTCYASLQMPR